MQPIYTQTLSSTTVVVNFTNIPQTYTDLQLNISTRSSGSTGSGSIGAYFSGAGYPADASWITGVGNGTSTSSSRNSAYQNLGNVNDTTHTSNTFSQHIMYMPEYTTSKWKQIIVDSVSETNGSAAQALMIAGVNRTSAPVTSISMDMGGNSFQVGSTFTLYGISRQ